MDTRGTVLLKSAPLDAENVPKEIIKGHGTIQMIADDLIKASQIQALSGQHSGVLFMRDVETHLTERRNDIPRPYSSVPDALRAKTIESSDTLSRTSAKSLRNFSGYLTALSYDKRARFIATMRDTFRSTAAISRRV